MNDTTRTIVFLLIIIVVVAIEWARRAKTKTPREKTDAGRILFFGLIVAAVVVVEWAIGAGIIPKGAGP